MTKIPYFFITVPSPTGIRVEIMAATGFAERARSASGRKMPAIWGSMGNSSRSIAGDCKISQVDEVEPDGGKDCQERKISWRAASGFFEAEEPLQIRSTVWRAKKISEESSESFPSLPIVFAGFLPFFPVGRRADLAYRFRKPSQRRPIRS